VLLDQHDVFNQHFGIVGKHAQYAPFFAFISSGNDSHRVVMPDIDSNMFSDYGLHDYSNSPTSISRNFAIA
jgi:hypothetical protein